MTTTATALRRGLTVAAATAAASIIWAVADPGLGLDLAVRQGDGRVTITAASVLAASLIPGLLAWALTAILERATANARPVWLATALISLAVSLAGPLLGGLGVPATLTLVLMHVTVGAILIVGLVPDRSRALDRIPSAR